MRLHLICGIAFTLCVVEGTHGLAGSSVQPQQPPGAQAPYTGSPFPKYPQLDTADSYRVVEDWPRKPADVRWGAMAGIAVDGADNVWTFHRGNVPMQVYRSDGSLVKSFGGGGMFNNPHAVRIDRAGNVWVVDNGYHTVRKMTPDGKVLLTLGTAGEAGNDETHMYQPTDVAIAPAGDIFVSDGYVNQRVIHFDKTGKFVKAWGTLGAGPGEFSLVHGIAIDSKGRLYVVDRNNSRIQVFNQSGTYVTEWRNLITPWAITITPQDDIYVVGSTPMVYSQIPPSPVRMNGMPTKDQVVMRFDTDGRVKHIWAFAMGMPGTPTKPGEVLWLHSVAVDSHGSLYVGDIEGQRAQKFVLVPATAPLRPASTSR